MRSRATLRISEQDLRRLNEAIICLADIERKLARRIFRLKDEEKKYVELCKEAVRKGNYVEAHVYASYIASVQARLRMVSRYRNYVVELRVKLICYRDVIMLLKEMEESLETLENTRRSLEKHLPSLASDIRNFMDLTQEFAGSLDIRELVPSDLEEFLLGTSESPRSVLSIVEEIKKAVLTEAEEVLPSPPERVAAEPVEAKEPEPIAVSLTDGSSCSLSPEEMDKQLLEYIRMRNGRINVAECARALGTTVDEVRRSLARLAESGKIRIRGL